MEVIQQQILMEDEIIIRLPKIDEFQSWAKLYQVYIDFHRTTLNDNELQRIWFWIQDPSSLLNCYFAEIDNQIVGLAHFRQFIRPISANYAVYLDDLVVSPEFRRRRVAFQLIEAIKTYARERNIPLVRWITGHDNHQAMKLYDDVANKTQWVIYDALIE